MNNSKPKIITILFFTLSIFFIVLNAQEKTSNQKITKAKNMPESKLKTEKEWKEILSAEEYYVLREKGTERPFTGKYWNTFDKGVYKCAGCGEILFDSKTKFDSDCGWPSFSDVVNSKKIIKKDDFSHGMHRIEVMCANCGGHLGHVFDDGPNPTGKRYCINSISLKFEKEK